MNTSISFLQHNTVTLIVNFVAIILIIAVVFYLVRKFFDSTSGNKLRENIKISSSYQNIFGFASVIVTSTLFNLFVNGVYNMMWIVLIISVLTIVFNILFETVKGHEDYSSEKLAYERGVSVIEKIIDCKGYTLIAKPDELAEIEDSSNEIYIFAERLITDIPKKSIPKDFQLSSALKNIGLFSNIVSSNIPDGKKYIYFLLGSDENKNYIEFYKKYHLSGENEKFIENITFYLIKSEEFSFFSDLYLYKNSTTKDRVFEWLPSIGEDNNPDKQFYLELSDIQVQNINEIICELMISNQKYKKEIDSV